MKVPNMRLPSISFSTFSIEVMAFWHLSNRTSSSTGPSYTRS